MNTRWAPYATYQPNKRRDRLSREAGVRRIRSDMKRWAKIELIGATLRPRLRAEGLRFGARTFEANPGNLLAWRRLRSLTPQPSVRICGYGARAPVNPFRTLCIFAAGNLGALNYLRELRLSLSVNRQPARDFRRRLQATSLGMGSSN